jgi:outer membrane lipoprotein carrier protein
MLFHLILAHLLLASPANDSLWQNLRQQYLGLRSLSGSFEEAITSEAEGTCQTFSGNFWSVLPDRYRLEVTQPHRQVIVANDTVLWFHFPTEKRAVREIQPRAVPLLAFLDPVLDSTTTARFKTEPDGPTTVHIEPADDMAAIQGLRLELANDQRRIDAFEFDDAWGNHYRFELRAQQWNPHLPATLFQFTPPAGTTVE